MERLTRKDNKGNYLPIDLDFFGYSEEITKLGQLEDIEEELGIDLLTLFKFSKKWLKHIRIGTDIVDKKECGASVVLVHSKDIYQIYETKNYEEVVLLEKLQKHLMKGELDK